MVNTTYVTSIEKIDVVIQMKSTKQLDKLLSLFNNKHVLIIK
jgi:hypothetical protein